MVGVEVYGLLFVGDRPLVVAVEPVVQVRGEACLRVLQATVVNCVIENIRNSWKQDLFAWLGTLKSVVALRSLRDLVDSEGDGRLVRG